MAQRSSGGGVGLWLWLGLALVVVGLDQFSKAWIVANFAPNHSQELSSWFNLVRVHNSGAAFSFLAGASGWQRWFFVGLGGAAAVFIVVLLARHGEQRLFGGLSVDEISEADPREVRARITEARRTTPGSVTLTLRPNGLFGKQVVTRV